MKPTAVSQGTQDTRGPLERVWDEIRAHQLEPYIAELDVQGYTVLPPEVAAADGFTDRLLEACLQVLGGVVFDRLFIR